MANPGLEAFRLAFELSPIMLTGGLASYIPYNTLPIIALTEAVNFTQGLLGGIDGLSADNAFAHFVPASGGTLQNNAVGTYPFANQGVAANAIIAQPLSVSMVMICPARGEGGYAKKLATMVMLKSSLDLHSQLGGTYTVVTPSYFYTNCILERMTDVGAGGGHQAQVEYRLDFTQPLLTLQQTQQALNSLMGKIAAGVPTGGATSGLGINTNVAALPGSGLFIPASSNLPGSNVAGVIPS